MSPLKSIGTLLREIIWPQRVICLCCGRPSRGGHLCRACEESLNALRVTGPVCEICGHPLEGGACVFCDLTGTAALRAAWLYRGETRQLVRLLKYGGVADAAQAMADGIASVARSLNLPPETVVTWPTMPEHRKRQRGIDHGELLARAVGERLSLPVRQLLTRSEEMAAAPQVGKSRAERLIRLRGAFSCPERISCPVLLVDDVLTTSATATTCADCLLNAGAVSVTVVTAAQAASRRQQHGKEVPEDAVEEADVMVPVGSVRAQRRAG